MKELINTNPNGSNANSWLFVSNSNSTFGSKLTYDGISYQYKSFYKKRYFPKLLELETIPKPDKDLIRNMLSKPWNLYVFRHSALTEKSQVLKEHVLRDHAGWTMSSKMPQVYIHYFGNESAKSLLEIKGIIRQENIDQVNILKSITCSNCLEPNKPNSRICASCKMILSYDVYTQTMEEKQKNDKPILEMQEKYENDMKLFKEDMENKIQQLTVKVNVDNLRKGA